MAETIALPRRARHSGDGPCRPDAAVGQRLRRLHRPGQRRGRRHVRADAARGRPRPAPFRSCSKKSRRRSRARSPRRSPSRPIGIGASPACDGQILVVDDMLGLFTDFRPKFVKRYAELGQAADAAIAAYAADVRARRFPAPEHTFADTPKPPAERGMSVPIVRTRAGASRRRRRLARRRPRGRGGADDGRAA